MVFRAAAAVVCPEQAAATRGCLVEAEAGGAAPSGGRWAVQHASSLRRAATQEEATTAARRCSDHRWQRASEVDALRENSALTPQARCWAAAGACASASIAAVEAPSSLVQLPTHEPDVSDHRLPRGRAPTQPRLPLGTGGLLDQALMGGMLNTEAGRREVAEFLAKATAMSTAPHP